MEPLKRNEILARYESHVRRFDEIRARRAPSVVEEISLPPRERPKGVPTVRELEVLMLMATGLENREIAERLSISSETVKAHVQNVFSRIGARNRAHAVAIGFRRGLIDRAALPIH